MANDLNGEGLRKVLTALLLVQLRDLNEGEQISILLKAGWTNSEVSAACGISENAVSIRKSRLKKQAKSSDREK